TVVVRSRGDVAATVSTVRGVLHDVDPMLSLYNVQTMESIVDQSTAQARLNIALLGVFGAVALALAALGVYGVISYSVAQRQEEIGVRMTLGAQAADVMWLVLREGLTLAATGVGIGVVAALFATRLVRSLLFEVAPTDPVTFAAMVVGLLVVGFVATYF